MHRSLRILVADLEIRADLVLEAVSAIRDHRLVDRVTNLQTHAKHIREEARVLLEQDLADATEAVAHFNRYRTLNAQLVGHETYELPLLMRFNDADATATAISWKFLEQIGWAFDWPLIGSHSISYYWTVPPLRIIGMPANEERRLLGLPVLAHEVGHIAFFHRAQILVGDFFATLHDYVNAAHRTCQGPVEEAREFHASLYHSWRRWSQEFVCDLFAAYLLGPAFSHQMFRVACIHGDPGPLFEPLNSSSHPADDARMRAACEMLRRIGQEQAAEQIHGRWRGLADILGQSPCDRYSLVYPDALIGALVIAVEQGCQELGLSPYTPDHESGDHLPTLVNEAWERLEKDPAEYGAWEGRVLRELPLQWMR